MQNFSTDALPSVSRRGTWAESVEVVGDDGTSIDISEATEILLEVRDQDDCLRLSGSLTGGQIVREASTGVFSWTFAPTAMCALCPQTYLVSVDVTTGGETIPILRSRLEVF